MMKNLKIGQLAKETGIKVETIRYYEKCGLITKPYRQVSGYREFTNRHIGQLNFIKQAKTMGFTLKEILNLFDLVNKKGARSEIHKFMEAKIQYNNAHISELKKTKQSLQLVLKKCLTTKSLFDCPLFAHLKP